MKRWVAFICWNIAAWYSYAEWWIPTAGPHLRQLIEERGFCLLGVGGEIGGGGDDDPPRAPATGQRIGCRVTWDTKRNQSSISFADSAAAHGGFCQHCLPTLSTLRKGYSK